jgi:hypothetical protein
MGTAGGWIKKGSRGMAARRQGGITRDEGAWIRDKEKREKGRREWEEDQNRADLDGVEDGRERTRDRASDKSPRAAVARSRYCPGIRPVRLARHSYTGVTRSMPGESARACTATLATAAGPLPTTCADRLWIIFSRYQSEIAGQVFSWEPEIRTQKPGKITWQAISAIRHPGRRQPPNLHHQTQDTPPTV